MLAKPPNKVLQKPTASAGPAQAQLPNLVDHSEANRSRAAQGLGVVLHHALQARAALKGRLGGIFVLRVDKLCNQASRARQGGGIGAHPENELVDVACRHQKTAQQSSARGLSVGLVRLALGSGHVCSPASASVGMRRISYTWDEIDLQGDGHTT